MHPRKHIRAYVEQILSAPVEGSDPVQYPTEAGASVFAGRDLPFGRSDFTGGILIYTNDEDIDRDHFHDDGQRRRVMRMEVQCYAMGGDDDLGEDRADLMAWQVENTLRANPNLGGLVERCDLLRTESAFADNGDQSLWVNSLLYEVAYWTHETVPDGGTLPVTVLAGAGLSSDDFEVEEYVQVAPAQADL